MEAKGLGDGPAAHDRTSSSRRPPPGGRRGPEAGSGGGARPSSSRRFSVFGHLLNSRVVQVASAADLGDSGHARRSSPERIRKAAAAPGPQELLPTVSGAVHNRLTTVTHK